MSKGRNQHVVKRANGWAVKGENTKRASTIQPTQEKAINTATKIAKHQQSEVIIHGRDNKIRERNTFGKDPFPPKG